MYRRPWRDSSARRLLFIAPFLVGLLSLGSGVAQATAPQDVFNNFNSGAVSNSPTTATVFTIKDSYLITMILDYHWNNGQAAQEARSRSAAHTVHSMAHGGGH